MAVQNWWPLVLVLLVPLIILLYMLKQNAREYPFSSGMLWREIYNSIEATKPWDKLKKNILMFLQIITVLFLILALMAPYLKSGGRNYSNVILVIDNSASMQIKYNDDRTRFEEAVRRAEDYVDSLSETTQVTLLTSAQEATIVKSNVTDKSELKKALSELQVTDLAGDAQPASTVVLSMVGQVESYDAIFMTDQPMELGELEAQVVNLYTDYQNLSLDYLSYGTEYDEDGNPSLTVIAKVTNDTGEDVVTDVDLYGDDTLLTVVPAKIPAGGNQIVYFRDVDFAGSVLAAEIHAQDSLAKDNRAYAAMNQSAMKKALLITQDNVFLEKAISTVTWVDLYKTNQVNAISAAEPYDLYIFDGVVPTAQPATGNILYLYPTKGSGIECSKMINNQSLEFVESELTDYVAGYSFGAASAKEYVKPDWAQTFISSADGCVGYYGEHEGRRIAVMGFDIHDTDLALQAEFPILVSNLMDYLMVSTMVPEEEFVTGDKVIFNASPNGSDLTITCPNEKTSTLPAAVATNAFTETEEAGIYKVTQTLDQGEKTEHFVVRFPIEQESHNKETVADENETVGTDTKNLSGGRDLRNFIIVLLLLLLGAEWFFYVKQH